MSRRPLTRRRLLPSSPTICADSPRESRWSTGLTRRDAIEGRVLRRTEARLRFQLPAGGRHLLRELAEKHRALDGALHQHAAAIRLVAAPPRQPEHAQPI